MDQIKFTLFAKLLYSLFIRGILKKAVAHSGNKIDDAAFEMIDRVAFGEK